MPRFVILEHDHPQLHWDLMLENSSDLDSWKLLADPTASLAKANEESAVELFVVPAAPHRLLYLDYEGPVSRGRGFVKRLDYGTFFWVNDSDQGRIIRLQGQSFNGLLKLIISAAADIPSP